MQEIEKETSFQRFFFGGMSDEERVGLEQMFVSDPVLLEEMRAFEDDLIEKYVRGWLSEKETTSFEKTFLNTERRRAKVAFYRQLIAEVRLDTASAHEEPANESLFGRFRRKFLVPKMAFATACALLILTLGSWFLFRRSDTGQRELAKGETTVTNKVLIDESDERPPVNVNSTAISDPDPAAVPPVTPRPKSTEPNEPEVEPRPTAPKTRSNPVLALSAGTLRSGGTTNVLDLSKNATGATFQLKLDEVDYKTFRAEITDGNGNVIFRSGRLAPRGSTISLFVPAKNLVQGDYRINLFGKTGAGEDESVADFQFRVIR